MVGQARRRVYRCYEIFFDKIWLPLATVFMTTIEMIYGFLLDLAQSSGWVAIRIVTFLLISGITIFCVCIVPHRMAVSRGWTIYHLVCVPWLILNTLFHFYMAAMTDPGHPPKHIPRLVAICKKCIAPKPPRCHHCRACNRCTLKMDHHCVWLNNCVGHFNHRYYYLFCVYLWIGFVYVSVSAYPLFAEHFYELVIAPLDFRTKKVVLPEVVDDWRRMLFRLCVLYVFFVSSGMFLLQAVLVIKHTQLISKGETTIEELNNEMKSYMRKEMGKTYTNPYDFGIWENWKRFLGLNPRRTVWRHVLLPSCHPPDEDGIHWRVVWNDVPNIVLQT